MFVRAKKQGKYTYYWLAENRKVGGKVRQKVIKYLGKNKPTPEQLEEIIRGLKK